MAIQAASDLTVCHDTDDLRLFFFFFYKGIGLIVINIKFILKRSRWLFDLSGTC